MMNFKIPQRSNGFVLMEVAVALAIMAILLTPVLMLQYTVFKRVIINKGKLEHLLPLKPAFESVLIEPLKEDETTRTETKTDPDMQIVYEKQPAEGSQFERFKELFVEKVTGTWQDWNAQRQEELGMLVFTPKPPEKKKKQ